MPDTIHTQTRLSVIEVRHLTPSTYILRLERKGFGFEAGQYIALGLPGKGELREYSIYSGEQEDFIEVLIKEVDEGLVSRQLKYLGPGAKIELDGPFGFFTINPDTSKEKEVLLIASGTGIAPFHSWIQSYSDLNYTLLHGVRSGDEGYESTHYDRSKYILCTSRDKTGDFNGRVTDYLKAYPAAKDTSCYLCGNSNMIHEAYDILTEHGVSAGNIHAEVYF